jgi:2-iminoacetate synthase ThiH
MDIVSGPSGRDEEKALNRQDAKYARKTFVFSLGEKTNLCSFLCGLCAFAVQSFLL